MGEKDQAKSPLDEALRTEATNPFWARRRGLLVALALFAAGLFLLAFLKRSGENAADAAFRPPHDPPRVAVNPELAAVFVAKSTWIAEYQPGGGMPSQQLRLTVTAVSAPEWTGYITNTRLSGLQMQIAGKVSGAALSGVITVPDGEAVNKDRLELQLLPGGRLKGGITSWGEEGEHTLELTFRPTH